MPNDSCLKEAFHRTESKLTGGLTEELFEVSWSVFAVHYHTLLFVSNVACNQFRVYETELTGTQCPPKKPFPFG